jgi:hypothetical protein
MLDLGVVASRPARNHETARVHFDVQPAFDFA